MPLSFDEQKKRYYKLVLEKANKIYASWKTDGIKSRRLVAQANAYTFDERLKLDAIYRFYVLAFIVALGIRLEKCYRSFFQRLFHIFAYLRERAAYRRLKKVFGFNVDSDIHEIIFLEIENIIEIFSWGENQDTTGGGKRAALTDIEIEETLNSFFEECAKEEAQEILANSLGVDKAEPLKSVDSLLGKPLDTQREKISVEELKTGTPSDMKKEYKPTKQEQPVKGSLKTTETDVVENKKAESLEPKSVASTSILAETMVLAEGKAGNSPSPFPIFHEKSESKPTIEQKLDSISTNENKTALERESGENFDKDIRESTDRVKDPFPVFHRENIGPIKTSEIPIEKEVKEARSINETKTKGETIDDFDFSELEVNLTSVESRISEENKTRIALNTTMRKEEIQAIAAQLKEAAKIEMNAIEKEWREQVSAKQGDKEMKQEAKEISSSCNKGVIAPK